MKKVCTLKIGEYAREVRKMREQNFWKLYKYIKWLAFIVRWGVNLTGRYGLRLDLKPIMKNDTEKDSDHALAMSWMTAVYKLLYGEIPDDDDLTYEGQKKRADFWEDLAIGLLVGDTHDVDEIKSGDTADDGHADRTAKEMREHETMTEVYSLFSLPIMLKLLSGFEQFQNRSTEFGEIEYVCDKFEAIWSNFLFDERGMFGSMGFKQEHFTEITEQDRYFMDVIGSDDPTQVWLAHGINQSYAYDCFDRIMAVTDVAMKEVYGERFAWLDDEEVMEKVKAYKIP